MTWWWIFKTEIVTRCRRSHAWLYPLGFFLIIVTLFPIAFSPDPAFLHKYVAGCIWIAALLASLLSIDSFYHADMEDGHLEQLLLSPKPLTLLLSAKLFAHWCVTQVPLILLTPLIGLMFSLSGAETTILAVSLILGTPILTLIGAFGVSLTLGLKQAGILLGLLILPLVAPIIIFAISAVQQIQMGASFAVPLALLAGLLVLALTLIPFTLAATLRITMES